MENETMENYNGVLKHKRLSKSRFLLVNTLLNVLNENTIIFYKRNY